MEPRQRNQTGALTPANQRKIWLYSGEFETGQLGLEPRIAGFGDRSL